MRTDPGFPRMTLAEAIEVLSERWNHHAEGYDRIIAPFTAAYAEEVVGRAGIKSRCNVLDIGTGTGVAALRAAALVGDEGMVVGIDLAPAFLKVARLNAERADMRNLSFRRMDASTLEFPDDSFDAVISNLGVYIKCGSLLKEAYRVLKPGAALSFSAAGVKPSEPARLFDQILAKHRVLEPGSDQAAYRQAVMMVREHSEQYRQPGRMEEELEKAGFRAIQGDTKNHRLSFPSPETYLNAALIGWGYNETEVAAMPAEVRKRFLSEVLDALTPISGSDEFVFEAEIRYFTAMK